MDIEDIPLALNWFENPTVIARAMGLAIDLPDPDCLEPGHLQWASGREWRRALAGKIDMTAEELARHDPDRVRLKRLWGTAEAWYDLETGIVIRCRAADIHLVASTIQELASRCRLTLSRRWPYSVVAFQTRGGTDPRELAPCMEAAGFRWDGDLWWVLQRACNERRKPGSRPHPTGAPGEIGSWEAAIPTADAR